MFSFDDIDRVPYFGEWAGDSGTARLQRDALAVLADAAMRCAEQDMRTPEVKAALAYLERHMVRPALCGTFRAALNLRDPLARASAAHNACKAIERAV